VVTSSTNEFAQALWYVAPGQAEIREEKLTAPRPGEVRVRALFGALSRGTEALVLAGRVSESEFDRMRAPFMGGRFPFPVKYGYATVGQIEDGPEKKGGRIVFALHPHQRLFNIPESATVALPETVQPQRAVLAANMETALNAVWDAAAGPADRIAIVGAGAVGALVAFLCGRLAGADVTLVDINESRAELAQKLGVRFSKPETAKVTVTWWSTPAVQLRDFIPPLRSLARRQLCSNSAGMATHRSQRRLAALSIVVDCG
jgi:NADPH:quinone reductase-like Zn-dependent oxidoreductase